MSAPSSTPEPSAMATVDEAELRAVRAELAAIRGELGQVLPQSCKDDAQLLAHVPTTLQVRADKNELSMLSSAYCMSRRPG